MSDASFWQGQTVNVPVVNTNGNVFEEVQVAAAGQTVFNIGSFEYTPNSHSIFVWKNGLMLRRAVDYLETSSTQVTMLAAAAPGDKYWFVAIAINQLIAPVVFNGLPSGGTTGQILEKSSNSDYDAAWMNPGTATTLLDAARVNIASASTVNLSAIAATTRNIQITGSIQIDGFQVSNGQVWVARFAAALTLKNNANIVTNTGADVLIQPGATCLIRATADNVVEIIGLTNAGRYSVLDKAYNTNTANVTIATIIPLDDTIPQVGEGTEILTATITPKSVNSTFRIRTMMQVGSSGSINVVAAIFKTGSVDAIKAGFGTTSNLDFAAQIDLEHEFVPGVITPVTISVRIGPGSAANVRLNGFVGGRKLGGVSAATLIVEEIAG